MSGSPGTRNGAKCASIGGLVVGGFAALEVWAGVREAIGGLFK